MKYRNADPREITARFESVCPETGNRILKGDACLYFPRTHQAFHLESRAAADWRAQQFADAAGLDDAGW